LSVLDDRTAQAAIVVIEFFRHSETK
jgi:hypothetical protein